MADDVQDNATDLTEFKSFYRQDYTRLIRFVIGLGAILEEAQDVAQEAMKAALIKWSEIQYPHAFVRKAARGIFLRGRSGDRARMRREFTARRIEAAAAAPFSFDQETSYVLDLVKSLPPAQREVMAWTIDGFEPAEIAAAIGKRPETVRTNLSHARRALQQKLMRHGASFEKHGASSEKHEACSEKKEGCDGP
ncbi:RNA polymerase sigma factor [Winogradskya humida]|uniref:RNA polymerase sigma factor 70 region 4 type 2 domain-containing protein n=1 Tax=Winogradskya humida TaxID=113566 RepID=A0ABQ3ZK94_9ACTN|nr:sigma-70 family RNA polymerase sigma factor [Actinoplanes humidus]GIE19000.1 hypothetical protein Ahu01nite_021020 [Actinoplanes humidus]